MKAVEENKERQKRNISKESPCVRQTQEGEKNG